MGAKRRYTCSDEERERRRQRALQQHRDGILSTETILRAREGKAEQDERRELLARLERKREAEEAERPPDPGVWTREPGGQWKPYVLPRRYGEQRYVPMTLPDGRSWRR